MPAVWQDKYESNNIRSWNKEIYVKTGNLDDFLSIPITQQNNQKIVIKRPETPTEQCVKCLYWKQVKNAMPATKKQKLTELNPKLGN